MRTKGKNRGRLVVKFGDSSLADESKISKAAKALFTRGISIFGIFTITSSVLVFVESGHREEAVGLIRASMREEAG